LLYCLRYTLTYTATLILLLVHVNLFAQTSSKKHSTFNGIIGISLGLTNVSPSFSELNYNLIDRGNHYDFSGTINSSEINTSLYGFDINYFPIRVKNISAYLFGHSFYRNNRFVESSIYNAFGYNFDLWENKKANKFIWLEAGCRFRYYFQKMIFHKQKTNKLDLIFNYFDDWHGLTHFDRRGKYKLVAHSGYFTIQPYININMRINKNILLQFNSTWHRPITQEETKLKLLWDDRTLDFNWDFHPEYFTRLNKIQITPDNLNDNGTAFTDFLFQNRFSQSITIMFTFDPNRNIYPKYVK
jgi:hypothetical protein